MGETASLEPWLAEVITGDFAQGAVWLEDKMKNEHGRDADWQGLYQDDGTNFDIFIASEPDQARRVQITKTTPLVISDGEFSIEAQLTQDCKRHLNVRYNGERKVEDHLQAIISIKKCTLRVRALGLPRRRLVLLLDRVDWRDGRKVENICRPEPIHLWEGTRKWLDRIQAYRRKQADYGSQEKEETALLPTSSDADVGHTTQDSQMPFGTQAFVTPPARKSSLPVSSDDSMGNTTLDSQIPFGTQAVMAPPALPPSGPEESKDLLAMFKRVGTEKARPNPAKETPATTRLAVLELINRGKVPVTASNDAPPLAPPPRTDPVAKQTLDDPAPAESQSLGEGLNHGMATEGDENNSEAANGDNIAMDLDHSVIGEYGNDRDDRETGANHDVVMALEEHVEGAQEDASHGGMDDVVKPFIMHVEKDAHGVQLHGHDGLVLEQVDECRLDAPKPDYVEPDHASWMTGWRFVRHRSMRNIYTVECDWLEDLAFTHETATVGIDQRILLSKPETWQKPEPPLVFPEANIPIKTLIELDTEAGRSVPTERMEEEIVMTKTELREAPSRRLTEIIDLTQILTDGDSSSDEEWGLMNPHPSHAETRIDPAPPSSVISWSPSPEPPQLPSRLDPGLPPDSSFGSPQKEASGADPTAEPLTCPRLPQRSIHPISSLDNQAGPASSPPINEESETEVDISDGETPSYSQPSQHGAQPGFSLDRQPGPPASSPPANEESDAEMGISDSDDDMEVSVPQALGEDQEAALDSPESRVPGTSKASTAAIPAVSPVVQVKETPYGKGRDVQSIALPSPRNQTSSGTSERSLTSIVFGTYEQPPLSNSLGGPARQGYPPEAAPVIPEPSTQANKHVRFEPSVPSYDAEDQDTSMRDLSPVGEAIQWPPHHCRGDVKASGTTAYESGEEMVPIEPEQSPASAQLPRPMPSSSGEPIPSMALDPDQGPAHSLQSPPEHNFIHGVIPSKRKLSPSPPKNNAHRKRRELKVVLFGKTEPLAEDHLLGLKRERRELSRRSREKSDLEADDDVPDSISSGIRRDVRSLDEETKPPVTENATMAGSKEYTHDAFSHVPDVIEITSSLRHAPVAGTRPSPSKVFDMFKEAYPAYNGGWSHFVKQCRTLYALEIGISKSRWDDYIIRDRLDYKDYASRHLKANKEPMAYGDFYRMRIHDVIFQKNIVKDNATLKRAIKEYEPQTQAQRSSPVGDVSQVPRDVPRTSGQSLPSDKQTTPNDVERKPARRSLPWSPDIQNASAGSPAPSSDDHRRQALRNKSLQPHIDASDRPFVSVGAFSGPIQRPAGSSTARTGNAFSRPPHQNGQAEHIESDGEDPGQRFRDFVKQHHKLVSLRGRQTTAAPPDRSVDVLEWKNIL
ncbi:hypothetical protein BCR34DRAFT_54944 [Clohesyomyces aquaticus]|uniref:Telomere replication protein EST3 n=1 Tax=Clohesyomyces aquaticus TaxID=1231657 RepID=A0A1Y1Z333_9PLEO|nr:hypothetical protein BCR34DRAFT_54944 [Clohesyomyces aquaticus]